MGCPIQRVDEEYPEDGQLFSIQRVDEGYSEDGQLYTAGGRGLYRGPLNGSASPPNGIRWPSVGLRAVRPHRALFPRAPQHHSSFASSSDHALLTMPPRRRRERDACCTEVL